ncbi:transposon Ty3-I Gag-Pol polyprotein [Nephila pilipes]|uniref:Transposon Ty3-I Gag-Pol polyprotein n=1 Tax=Nephila pilipes TaxID=299642 RepID=A0A8X6PHQ1_NEPPI|nr:transposon Ty3-I Gag-Pol polyprotein [Nephila pilipes]
MIYGASIRLPGELLYPNKQKADPAVFVGRLRESTQRLSQPMTRYHGQNTIFMSKDLITCSHVFMRIDSMKNGLRPPYQGPYKIVNHTEKMFRVLRHGKKVSVSVNRLKPAYVPKVLVDIPVEVHKKENVSSQPDEVLGTEQDNSTGR